MEFVIFPSVGNYAYALYCTITGTCILYSNLFESTSAWKFIIETMDSGYGDKREARVDTPTVQSDQPRSF